MKRLLSICLAAFILLSMLPAPIQAEGPLKVVNIQVDKTSVKVGDTITVTWEVTGGTPPYESELEWNAVYSIDAGPQEFSGSHGSATMTVKSGMIPVIKFYIKYKDSKTSWDTYYADPVSSDSIRKSVQNTDGWRYPADTAIVLEKNSVQIGKPIAATVLRAYDIEAGTYMGFDGCWVLMSDGMEVSRVYIPETIWPDGYGAKLSLSPTVGTSGYLQIYAYDYMSGDDNYKDYYTIFQSDTFIITKDPPPVCSISLSNTSVAGGAPVTASYHISGTSYISTYWEIEKPGTIPAEAQRVGNAPKQGSSIGVFSKQGRVRFVVSTRPPGSHHMEEHPVFYSDWVTVTSDVADPVRIDIGTLNSSYHADQTIPFTWQITGGRAPYQVSYGLWGKHRAEEGFLFDSGSITQNAAGIGSATLRNYGADGAFGYIVVQVTDARGLKDEASSIGYSIIEPLPTQPDVIYGDADGNGKVDLLDLQAMIDYLVLGHANGHFNLNNADVDGKDGVDIKDMLWVIGWIVN